MEIETKNSSLDTLAVTILALHVSGKQMTLAVFRQLPKNVENDESELWGIVRYSIKNEGDVWLVFSKDGILFRRALDFTTPYVSSCDIDNQKYIINNLNFKLKFARYENDRKDLLLQIEKHKILMHDAIIHYDNELNRKKLKYNKEKELSELRQLFILA